MVPVTIAISYNYLNLNLLEYLTKVVEGDVELLYVDEHWSFRNSDHLFITWDTHRPRQIKKNESKVKQVYSLGIRVTTHKWCLALWDSSRLSRGFRFQLHSWAAGLSCSARLFAREKELCQEPASPLLFFFFSFPETVLVSSSLFSRSCHLCPTSLCFSQRCSPVQTPRLCK